MPGKKLSLESGGAGGQMKLSFGQKSSKQAKLAFAPASGSQKQSQEEVSKKRRLSQVSSQAVEQPADKSAVDQVEQPGDKRMENASSSKVDGNQSKPSKRLKRNDENENTMNLQPKAAEGCDGSQASLMKKAQPKEESKTTPSKATTPSKQATSEKKPLAESGKGQAQESAQINSKSDQKPAALPAPSGKASQAPSKGGKSVKVEERKEVNLPLKPYETLKPLNDLNFCPVKDSPQHQDQRMPFSFMVKALQLIEQQEGKNSRTVVVEIITNVFRSALMNFPEELSDVLYFFIVKLAPDFAAMETGIGHEVSVKAVSKCCGKTPKDVRELYKEEGDLGLVVQKAKGTQGTLGGFFKKAVATTKKTLTFNHVFSEFRRIARTSGKDSAGIKEGIIVKLLQDASNDEAKYIIRFLQKTLKTGAAEKTVIVALARAIVYTPPNKPGTINQKKKLGEEAFLEKCAEAEHSIKQAICECPDYEKLVNELMQCGDEHELLKDTCKIQVGLPVKPMLAKPTKGVQVVLQRFEGLEFTCEYKYDGFRGQIHYNRKHVDADNDSHIYSRNLENMSGAYPDVLDIIREVANEKPDIDSFIIDSELVAYDTEQDIILPFQALTQRSRKHVNETDLKTKIAIQAFDLLYFNDCSLLQETFEKRRDTLYKSFGEMKGKFMFAKNTDTSSFEELEKFLDESIKDRCEGLMVKTLNVNSTYEPSKRSFNWLKLKKDYLDTGLGDSVDLCVVGADYGAGKRAGWFGSFLMACWNDDLGCFQTVCKVGTGLSDEMLAKAKAQLEPFIINAPPSNVKAKVNLPQVKCDVYFEPKFVWEIKAADLSVSPMHTAAFGSVEAEKGIALRFPRMIRERDDKSPDECTNSDQITEMYRGQAAVQVDFGNDDDFDF